MKRKCRFRGFRRDFFFNISTAAGVFAASVEYNAGQRGRGQKREAFKVEHGESEIISNLPSNYFECSGRE